MKITDAIDILKTLLEKHGDLEVKGWTDKWPSCGDQWVPVDDPDIEYDVHENAVMLN